jgi:hypothetical protein
MPSRMGDFQDFALRQRALVELPRLSCFDDDPWWRVEALGEPPLRQDVRAPSQVVLVHAASRAGLDQGRVTGPMKPACSLGRSRRVFPAP